MSAVMKASLYRMLVVGICAAALQACATIQVSSDYDRSANFAGYHTFTLMPREPHGPHNPLVAPRTEDAITQQLQPQG